MNGLDGNTVITIFAIVVIMLGWHYFRSTYRS